jgi:rhodanese-related sulfurtransferase
MKKRILLLVLWCICYLTANAQLGYRFDNVSYKAIYLKQACDLMAKNPNLVILDVRSPGEYADTSRFRTLNLGRITGAINIPIDSVKAHYDRVKNYKDKTVLVYCSHSNRSRTVSKLLADSGFKNVYNLNGGMTEFVRAPEAAFPCKSSLYTSTLPYHFVGPVDAGVVLKDKNTVIIDLRTETEFASTDTGEYNNIGRLRNAINIPLKTLKDKLAELEKYKTRRLFLYDHDIYNSVTAAMMLTSAGFKNVDVLAEGLPTILTTLPSSSKLRKEIVEDITAYKIIGVKESFDLIKTKPGLVIADLRPKEQFENKYDGVQMKTMFNIGHINNSTNFTPVALEEYLKDKPKTTPVLIYGTFSPDMSGMKGIPTDFNASSVCKELAGKGYSNVYLLYNGLFGMVASAANVEGAKDAANILVDHEGLY